MLTSLSRRFAALLLAGLAIAGLSGCFAVQQRIEPYPEGGGPPPAVRKTQPPTIPAGQGQGQAAMGAGQPGKGTPAGPPKELLPLLTQVDDRIAAYEDKLRSWADFRTEADRLAPSQEMTEKIAGCQGQAQGILARYNQLHELLIRAEAGPAQETAATAQLQVTSREDIAFLEGECQQLIAGGQQPGTMLAGSAARMLEENEQELAAAMAASDYSRVIALYEQLSLAEGQKPSFATVSTYGQALLRSGREQDAARVFVGLLQDVQQQNQVGREFQLMQMVADIHFSLEEYNDAFTGYVNIINRYAGLGENIEWARKQQTVISSRTQQAEEVKGFAALLRANLGFSQARDGYKVVLLAERFLAGFPESAVTPTVNRILFEARDRAEAWFAGNLQQVNQLREAGKYEEARQLLQGLLLQGLPPDKQTQLQVLADEMNAVQAREAETRRSAEEATLQETWNKAQAHLQMKEYAQAIAVLSSLENTAYAEQAKVQIRETANLAAQEDRQKAAELFVQAGESRNQAARVALLQQSRRLLQSILVNYPQTDLLDKVRKNLERIEQDLRAIDPALLSDAAHAPAQGETALQVGGSQVQPPAGGPSDFKVQE